MRWLVLTLTLASALGVAATVAHTAGSASGRIKVEATITDVRITGHRPGDHRIEKYRLWNRAITPLPIGNGVLVCTYLGDHRSFCTGQFIMPLGKLTVAGTRRAVYRAFLLVTGGTRSYSGTSGTLSMLQGDEPRSLALLFEVA